MKTRNSFLRLLIVAVALGLGNNASCEAQANNAESVWNTARQRAVIYEDCGKNAARLLRGWIDKKRDPVTHL